MGCLCDDPLAPFALDYFVGDTASLRAALTSAITGLAFNLSDCALTFTVKVAKTDADAAALWRITTDDGIVIYDAAGGIALITPPAPQSAALTPGLTYQAELVVTNADGQFITAARGYLAALQRATVTPAT